jgi:hypothetical protein
MTETNTDNLYCSKERRDQLINSFCDRVSQWQQGTMVDIPLSHGSPLAGNAEYRDYRDSWKDLVCKVSCQFQTQEEHNMYVFDVTIVDRESDEIVYDSKVVASTSEQAKMLAMADIMRESAPVNGVIANYHFSVAKIGEGYSK